MATGPHCSDVVQLYILQMMSSVFSEDDDSFEQLIDPSQGFNGVEEWSTGEVFNNGVLRRFDSEEDNIISEMPEYGFRALDQIYGALRSTSDTQERLEGFEELDEFNEKKKSDDIDDVSPLDNLSVGKKTWWKWKNSYEEAGLIDDEEITEEGQVFLDTSPEGYRFDETDLDLGKIYQELHTQSYGDTEANNGTHIQAFFLYGGGFNHADVSEQLDVSESSIRQSAYNLQDLGILSDNLRFTPEGYEFANMVMDQLDRLEAATEARVAAVYEDWSDVDPENFDGNTYMAKTLKHNSHNH